MMRWDWKYWQNNKARLYAWARVAIAVLGAFVFIFPGMAIGKIWLLLLGAGLAWQIGLALGYGAFLKGRPFKTTWAVRWLFLDLLIAFALQYPITHGAIYFAVIPALVVTIGTFLAPEREFRFMLLGTAFLLLASSITYGALGLVAHPLANVIAQAAIYALLIGGLYLARQTAQTLEKEKHTLKHYLQTSQQEREKLQQRLLILQKGTENLSKNVKRRDIEIQNILTLSEQMNIGKDSREVLHSFLLTAVGQMGSAHAFIMAREQKNNNYWNIVVQKGLRSIHPREVKIYLDGNLISLLRSMREPMPVKQIPRDNLFSDELVFLEQFPNDIICPVYVQNRLIGLVSFGPKVTGRPFLKEDLNMILIVANQTAFVLDQVQKADDYRDQFSRTVKAMLYALEAKFMFTRGHLLRTTNYVATTAKRLGFSQTEIQQLGMGTLLHDIGKTAVRDKYLLYDGALSNTDKDLKVKERILTHTIEGGKILKAAGFSSMLVDMALHHHEHFNGRGFPHGLAGEEIPIQTRILAACNAFDAMTSDRPYRKALPKSTAMAVLEQQAGQQFDPEVVKAFLDVLKGTSNQAMYH